MGSRPELPSEEHLRPAAPKRRGPVEYLKDSRRLAEAPLTPSRLLPPPPEAGLLERRLVGTWQRLGGLMEALADELELPVPVVLATWYVEGSRREPEPGRAILRFENHLLYKTWGRHSRKPYDAHFRHGDHGGVPGKPWENHGFRDEPGQSFQEVHQDQVSEHRAFALASRLAGEEVALRCVRLGNPLLPVSWHELLGYPNARGMFEAFQSDERAQLLGLFDLIRQADLLEPLQQQRWEDFARGYNGLAESHGYAEALADLHAVATGLLTPRMATRRMAHLVPQEWKEEVQRQYEACKDTPSPFVNTTCFITALADYQGFSLDQQVAYLIELMWRGDPRSDSRETLLDQVVGGMVTGAFLVTGPHELNPEFTDAQRGVLLQALRTAMEARRFPEEEIHARVNERRTPWLEVAAALEMDVGDYVPVRATRIKARLKSLKGMLDKARGAYLSEQKLLLKHLADFGLALTDSQRATFVEEYWKVHRHNEAFTNDLAAASGLSTGLELEWDDFSYAALHDPEVGRLLFDSYKDIALSPSAKYAIRFVERMLKDFSILQETDISRRMLFEDILTPALGYATAEHLRETEDPDSVFDWLRDVSEQLFNEKTGLDFLAGDAKAKLEIARASVSSDYPLLERLKAIEDAPKRLPTLGFDLAEVIVGVSVAYAKLEDAKYIEALGGFCKTYADGLEFLTDVTGAMATSGRMASRSAGFAKFAAKRVPVLKLVASGLSLGTDFAKWREEPRVFTALTVVGDALSVVGSAMVFTPAVEVGAFFFIVGECLSAVGQIGDYFVDLVVNEREKKSLLQKALEADKHLSEKERELLLEALASSNGERVRATARMGLKPEQIQRLLLRYPMFLSGAGFEVEAFRGIESLTRDFLLSGDQTYALLECIGNGTQVPDFALRSFLVGLNEEWHQSSMTYGDKGRPMSWWREILGRRAQAVGVPKEYNQAFRNALDFLKPFSEPWAPGADVPPTHHPDDSFDVASQVARLPALSGPQRSRLLEAFLGSGVYEELVENVVSLGFRDVGALELARSMSGTLQRKARTGRISEQDQQTLYTQLVGATGRPELVARAPSLTGLARCALLSTGFSSSMASLLLQLQEPVRTVSIDFDPRALLERQRVLIIPSGGLYGLGRSGTFRDRLDTYVSLGGTVLCMAQERGRDFEALPGGLQGYGWAEDQSCYVQSVLISSPHPVFAGQAQDLLDMASDGFFTAWPENTEVLLRRRVNGQPALLTYRYSAGRVVATTAYADWGSTHNQLTRSERVLLRDILAWARGGCASVPEFDPDVQPYRLEFPVSNSTREDAARLVLDAVDPDRNVLEARFKLDLPVAAGETRTVGLDIEGLKALGFWSLDARLESADGRVLATRPEVARFLVDNFDDTLQGIGYKAVPLAFSAVADDEHLLEGGTARLKLLIWNYSEQTRTLQVRTSFNAASPQTQPVRVPARKRVVVPFDYPRLARGGYNFQAELFAETGGSLGSSTKGIFVYAPSVTVRLGIDKNTYRPGEVIQVRLEYTNATRALYPADVLVAIQDPSGETLFDERFSEELRPEIPGERAFSFTLPMTVRYGAFKVLARVEVRGARAGYQELFFTPVLEGRLSGRVLDSVSGAPVPGARAWLDGNPPVTPDAATGAFSFVTSAGGHFVTAEAPGHGRARVYSVVAPERTARVEHLYLAPISGRLEGLVLDLVSNQPIAGARVMPASFTTGADGAFQLTLPRGEQNLSVEAPGYAGKSTLAVQVHAGRTSRVASFFLAPTTGRVEGRVLRADNGEPLVGAEVYTPGSIPLSVDAEGRFALTLPIAEWQLQVRASGHVEARVVISVLPGRTVRLEDFFLLPTHGEIAGVVRDSLTGEPLPGALVMTGSTPPCLTREDGRFSFRLQAVNQTLTVRAPGYQDKSLVVAVVAGKRLEGFELGVLPLQGRLEGVVRDSGKGQPLAGALVRILDGEQTFTAEDGSFSLPAGARQVELRVSARGYTDAQGSAEGSFSAEVLPGRTTRLDALFLMALRGALRGRLVDASRGEPIPHARLWVDGGGEARTDATGSFRVEAPPGLALLHAEAEGTQGLQRLQVEVPLGQEVEVGDVPLAANRSGVSGVLRDANGAGLAGIKVYADSVLPEAYADALPVEGKVVDRWTGRPIAGARVGTSSGLFCLTSTDGAYRLLLTPGTHTLSASAPGYRQHSHSFRVEAGFASRLLRLGLRPERGQVTVQVASALSGVPLSGARVWHSMEAWGMTDEDGRCTLSLPPGEQTLSTSLPGHAAPRSVRIQVSAGQTVLAPTLFPQPQSGWLEGSVRDTRTGAPIPDALVWLEGRSGVRTDARGHFRLKAPAGSCTVNALAEGYPSQAQAIVTVQAGTTSRLEALHLPMPWAEVTGTVRRLGDDTPVAGARVWADSDLNGLVLTGEDGRFRLRVSGGVHLLQAEKNGFQGRASAELSTSTGRTTEADVLFLLPVGATPPTPGTGTLAGRLLDAVTEKPLAGLLVWWDEEDAALGLLRQEGSIRGAGAEPYPDARLVAGDSSWSDATLRFAAKAVSGDGWGFLLRYRDARNHYRFLWAQNAASGPFWRFERVVEGQRTLLASGPNAFPQQRWLEVEARAVGNEFRVTAGELELLRVRDDALTSGGVGLLSVGNPGQLFRAIRVEGPEGSLLEEDFRQGLSRWSVPTEPGAPPPASRWNVVPPRGTLTDEDGSFRLEGIPPGQHAFFFGNAGYVTGHPSRRMAFLPVHAGQSSFLTVHPLPQRARLEGVLRHATTGAPADGIGVRIEQLALSTRTAEDGSFSLELPAVDTQLNPQRWSLRASLPGNEVQVFQGTLPPGGSTSLDVAVSTVVRGEVSLSLTSALSGEPVEGVDIYYGDPTFRWGGFSLAREEGTREGDSFVEGPTLLAGEPGWSSAELRFEAFCGAQAGWGAVLRYQGRHATYRLLYLTSADGRSGQLSLVRRQGARTTVLGEVRRAHETSRWLPVRFSAKGSTLTVELDGQGVLTVEDDTFATGQAGLLLWGRPGQATLRKVEVRTPEGMLVRNDDTSAWSEAPGFGFQGGSASTLQGPFTGTAEDVSHSRYGAFSYHFPVPDGEYRVEMTFVEPDFNRAGQRVFDIDINGQVVERGMDLFTAAGGAKVAFRRSYVARPRSGWLRLGFRPTVNNALVCFIRVWAGASSAPEDVPLYVVRCGSPFDRPLHQATSGFGWAGGGSTRSGGTLFVPEGTPEELALALRTWREGNCSYKLHLAPGTHTVELFFVEPAYLWPGNRVQEVWVDGAVVVRNMDLSLQAGRGRPHREVLTVRSTGAPIELSVRGVTGSPVINAIRVDGAGEGSLLIACGAPSEPVWLDARRSSISFLPVTRASSGADGMVRLRALPAGEYTLRFETPGWVSSSGSDVLAVLTAQAGLTTHSSCLLYPATGALEGQVLEAGSGKPISGAEVWFADRRGLVRSAEDGTFRIEGVPLGTQSISLAAAGHQTPGGGQYQVQLPIDSGGTIPLELWLVPPGYNPTRPLNPAGRTWLTGEDGAWRLTLPPGRRTLYLEGTALGGRRDVVVDLHPGRELRLDLRTGTAGAGELEAKVTRATGGALPEGLEAWWGEALFMEGGIWQRNAPRAPASGVASPYRGTHLVTGDPSWTDYQFSFQGRCGAEGGWGCVFRYMDERNHYRFSWVVDPTSGPWRRLELVRDGTFTTLAEDRAPYPVGTWLDIRISALEDALAVVVGGREVFLVREGTHPSGQVGLYAWGPSVPLFRRISVQGGNGETLLAGSQMQGLEGWSVIDAPGATPVSRWEWVAPTAARAGDGGALRLQGLPSGTTQRIFMRGQDIRTGSDDGSWLSLPIRPGDRWSIEGHVATSRMEPRVRVVDALTRAPIPGARIQLASGARQSWVSDARGEVTLPLMLGAPFAPTELSLYVTAAGYRSVEPSPQLLRPLLAREGRGPLEVRLLPAASIVRGQVMDALRGEPVRGAEVFWGHADLARGSVRLVSGRWSGEPLTGVLRGPGLLTPGRGWSDASVAVDLKAVQRGGLVLQLRYRDLGSGYRALVLNDPDQNETAITEGRLRGNEVQFTRKSPGGAQLYTGTLLTEGELAGTVSSPTGTYRFRARRRVPAGGDSLSGEWLMNSNATWYRLLLSPAPDGGFIGRCVETAWGGTAVRIERWWEGRREVLAEVLGQSHPLNEWTNLRFQVSGNLLRLHVGDRRVLEVTDPHPLPAGRAGLQLIGGAETLLRQPRVKSSTGAILFREDFVSGLGSWDLEPGGGGIGGSAYRVDGLVADDDEVLVTSGRMGTDLQYAFPVPEGAYRVELSFCEHQVSSAGARIFDVYLNDVRVETGLDLFAMAGARRLVQRTYPVRSGPAGLLLRLRARTGAALINHIRIWPASVEDSTSPPLISVRAGRGEVGDPELFLGSNGWGFVGGFAYQAPAQVTVPGVPAEELPLLLNQRQGSFRYLFDLPPGRYEVELSFVELQNPRRAGVTVFDVLAQGGVLLERLDVAQLVGDRLLRLRPMIVVGAERRLELDFTARQGAASVSLIRVFAEGGSTPLYTVDAGGPTDREWSPGLSAATLWAARPPQGDVTDAQGRFRIPSVPPGQQGLWVRGEDVAVTNPQAANESGVLCAGREHVLDLRVRRASGTFSGEVVDIVDGKPIEGTEIWFQGSTKRWRSDAFGAFRIEGFPTDRRNLYARAPGYRTPGASEYVMSATVGAGEEWRHRIVLTPLLASVEGLLKDAVTGAPVEGAQLWLGTQRRGIVTGPDGRFRIDNCPADQAVSLHGVRDGYRAPRQDGHLITLQAVAGRLNRFEAFLLPTHGFVQGRVLDLVTEAPVAGALLYVDSGELSTSTDALGRFRLRVPAGEHRLYLEAAGLISEVGHSPATRFTAIGGKTLELTLYLKSISGLVKGEVLDSITQRPVPGALVYVDEGFANTLTDSEGRYVLPQSNREHAVYVKAMGYTSDREDGWVATASIESDRAVVFNHLLRPTLQQVAFSFEQVPERLELVAGQLHTVTCRVRNTGSREGGATVRLVVGGFQVQENTEWIPPGQSGELSFQLRMPDDALSAPHQEVFLELKDGERRGIPASVKGASVSVEATLDRPVYAVGDTARLRLRISNLAGGTYRLFTRAQLGEFTTTSALDELTDTLEVEHAVPVDAETRKLAFGVFLETGRGLHLDAFYLPRRGELVSASSDRQSHGLGDTVLASLSLTEAGRALFDGFSPTCRYRLLSGEEGRELLPVQEVPMPAEGPCELRLVLPAHLRQGTCLLAWELSGGERSTQGSLPLDVRGYQAFLSELGTDRSEYLHKDTVVVEGMIELSHPLRCRLEVRLVDPALRPHAAVSLPLDLPAGRSPVRVRIPLETPWAGLHRLSSTLWALPEEAEPLRLADALDVVEVAGPVLLALGTNRRHYRSGEIVRVALTARGSSPATLRLSWDTGEVALETVVTLAGVHALSYELVAPDSGASSLVAELLGDTRSIGRTAVRVDPKHS